jgi:hypothetical protein
MRLMIKLIVAGMFIVLLTACNSSTHTVSDVRKAAIEFISDYAENGGEAPTLQHYIDAGVQGVDESNLEEINAVVEGLIKEDVDTLEEVQNLVNELNVKIAPVADAGEDVTIVEGEDKNLSASASYDPDGSIVDYAWREGDSLLGSEENLSLSELITGEHTITLTVTDDEGATDEDNVTVTVLQTPNIAPVAKAGSDVVMQEGEDVNLSGSDSYDPDGSIVDYAWREGDSLLGSEENLSLSELITGEHTITLTVTDDEGATDEDNVTVTVTAIPMIIDDNFDDVTVGTLPPGWTIKYNGTGTENQIVVDTIYNSPYHSFQLEGRSGYAANIITTPSSIPENVTVEANINIDNAISGLTGQFGWWNYSVGTWGTEVGGIYFSSGKFYVRYVSGNIYDLGSFTAKQWYHVKIVYNLTAKTYQVYIDGVLREGNYGGNTYTTFPMHPTVSPREWMLTAGNGGTVKVFFDDIKMY